MELNAVLHVRNAFTNWSRTSRAPAWVAPFPVRRGVESGIVVASQAHALGDAIIDAAGPACRHGVDLVVRRDDKICLQYRCPSSGADGCGLLGPLLGALRPVLGRDGFVRSLRFDGDGALLTLSWPPAPADRAENLRALLDEQAAALHPFGFRPLDLRGDADTLMAQAAASPGLKVPELETLLVALESGYYELPRRCTMEDIAHHFGLSKSAIYHRIHAAEREAVRYLTAARQNPPPELP